MNARKRVPATPTRAALLATIVALVAALALPATAFADVRKADVILGETVEQRGLTMSECPAVDAQFAALIDDSGTLYFDRNATGTSQIASITKVMTAIVAIDNAPSDSFVVVSAEAATIGESSAELAEGDAMDLHTALTALLVPSGNDAAVAIAQTVGASMIAKDPSLGSDPMQVFVDAMNAKAAEIGCTDTFYDNPHGLDEDVYGDAMHSTALDQCKVAQYAMGYDEIRNIVGGGSTTITVTRNGQKVPVDLETTDALLDMYEYATGVKTGYTGLAGACFMGSATKDGRNLYAVVLGSSSEEQRFYDTLNLFDWAYKHVVTVPLVNTDRWTQSDSKSTSADVPVVAEVSHSDYIDKTVPATVADPDASLTVFDLEGNVTQNVEVNDIRGTVHAGDKVGTIQFKQHNEVIAEQDLIACKTVSAPNPLEALSIWWQRAVGGLSGSSAQAETQVYNVMPVINNHTTNAI